MLKKRPKRSALSAVMDLLPCTISFFCLGAPSYSSATAALSRSAGRDGSTILSIDLNIAHFGIKNDVIEQKTIYFVGEIFYLQIVSVARPRLPLSIVFQGMFGAAHEPPCESGEQ
jgi:hypothetical protein